ncbi:MAG: Gfo/Idh/MocA family oxidoreductase [Anaerolineae bacterium]|nr:Gfo/Idh/MocA family oxidoreductase [Anaerolineae bacterium]
MTRTVRWGMIGAGDVTEVKSGPGFRKADNSALVAVMRRNGALAEDYAKRHGVPRWYDDGQALIDDPEVDAVYIATPPNVHQHYTLLAAKAGKPVYVEKPMAMTFAECQVMIDACEQAKVPLWVAYYRRSLPRFLKVKALLEDGAIGDLRSVTTLLYRPLPASVPPDGLPWRVLPEVAGAGHFLDVGSHMLDLLDYLVSPIRAVTGFAANQAHQYPSEDQVVASYQFENGVLGVGLWCFNTSYTFDQIELVGTKGKITFPVYDAPTITLTTADHQQQFEIANPPHIQQPMIQAMVDELNGSGTCPSTGHTAARTSWVMDQLVAAYYKR